MLGCHFDRNLGQVVRSSHKSSPREFPLPEGSALLHITFISKVTVGAVSSPVSSNTGKAQGGSGERARVSGIKAWDLRGLDQRPGAGGRGISPHTSQIS